MRSRCKADRALVLHLLGCAGESLGPELDKRLDAAIERCEAAARPKGAWRLFETCESPGSTEVVGTSLALSGAAPREALSGCRHVALMACTLRDAFEREHGVAAQPSVLEASRALGVSCMAYGSWYRPRASRRLWACSTESMPIKAAARTARYPCIAS